MKIAKLKNTTKKLGGEYAVKGISLQINKNEKIALLGLSGAGKTTLFRLLNTSLTPDSGSLELWGKDPSNIDRKQLRELRSRIGSIYQGGALVPRLKVVDNVMLGEMGEWGKIKTLKSLVFPEYEKPINALENVGLKDKAFKESRKLSGGESQRAAIARVIAQEPELILADEPVSHLDPVNAKNVMNVLTGIVDQNSSLVASLHQTENVKFFDRVIGVKEGEVHFDTTPDEAKELFDDLYGDNDEKGF